MTTHEQNKKAIREGQQGGAAQKNQDAQGAHGAEQDLNSRSGVQQGQRQQDPQSKPVGHYNPGGQAGESVQGGGQRPADQPGGPFLGKSAGNPTARSASPGHSGTPGGKDKQDTPQNQRR